MMKHTLLALLLGHALLGSAPAAVITGVTATATSSWGGYYVPDRLVDGSGLTVPNDITSTHDPLGIWHTGQPNNTTPSLTFNLGGTHDLAGIYIWNHNQGGNWGDATNRGVNTFNVLVSTDGGATYAPALSNQTLAKTPYYTNGAGTYDGYLDRISAQSFDLTGFNGVTHVRIDVLSNHGDPGYTGLSEVMFTANVGVPSLVVTSPFDYGTVSVLATPQESIPISNDGTPLTITDVTVTGADADYFTVDSFPTTLDAAGIGAIAVTFDPNGAYDLDEIYLWQMNQFFGTTDNSGRGLKQFDLFVSSDGTNFTEVASDLELARATNGPVSAQAFALNQSGVTHVRIEFDSAWSDATNEYVGLDEVMFTGTPAVPPSNTPYEQYIATTWGLTGPDAAPDFDYDVDGLPNAIEFVLGGDPTLAEGGRMFARLAVDVALSPSP